MSTLSRICFALGVFLLIAGVVYGITSTELAGTTLLLVAAAASCFLGIVSRVVAGHAAAAGTLEEEEEPHIGPTIWPFGFAIAAVILALGLIVTPWFLIAGAILFAVSAAGWLREVARSRTHANPA